MFLCNNLKHVEKKKLSIHRFVCIAQQCWCPRPPIPEDSAKDQFHCNCGLPMPWAYCFYLAQVLSLALDRVQIGVHLSIVSIATEMIVNAANFVAEGLVIIVKAFCTESVEKDCIALGISQA